ncbi:MAG: hypothetical protein KGL39_45655, partial [Patescibacteria group bacterium]|nr:hypothetical protein [Patescibacteria group bacterium]
MIITPEEMRQQPQKFTDLNREGVGVGLVDAIIPWVTRRPVSSRTAFAVPEKNGLRGSLSAAAQNDEVYLLNPATSDQWTFFVYGYYPGTKIDSYQTIADFFTTSGTYNRLGILAYSSQNLGFGESAYVQYNSIYNTTTPCPAGKPFLFTVTIQSLPASSGTVILNVYLNGQNIGSQTTTG